jgi:hypothetical protein
MADWIFRYVQVFLAWPAVTLVLGLVALVWLRKPISDFLRRIRSAQGYGVRLDAVDPAQQLKEAQAADAPKSVSELVAWVSSHPDEAAATYSRLFNGYWWERALNLIYGSQIEILEHLEARGDRGESYVNLVSFFEEFRRRGGPAATQMAEYLAFLKNFSFIEYVTQNADQLVRITPFGVNFLSYLRAEYPGGYKFKPW